eukprot:jgi/Chrzof1/12504/Cz06g36200.t1
MSTDENVLAGARQFTRLGSVLEAVAQRIQQQFSVLLADQPGEQNADARAKALLQFLHGARQQLLRATALLYDTRKFGMVAAVAQPGSILDVAASHARSLMTAADELYGVNQHLKFLRVPIYDIQSASDILSTGTYPSLPSSIEDYRGPQPLQPDRQQHLEHQLTHLLYSHLIKAHLPDALQVLEVTQGYAVLRCKGLYEIKLTLHQRPYPAAAAAAAAAATLPGSKHDAAVATPPPQQQQPKQMEVRWQWHLLDAVLLPNAAHRDPLRPVQKEQLLNYIRALMWQTSDAAAVEAAARSAAAHADSAPADADKDDKADPSTSAPAVADGPSMSHTTSGGAAGFSTVSTTSGMSGKAQVEAGRGLQLELHAADEYAAPLRVMHGALRDVSATLLLDAAHDAAKHLETTPGSRWQGNIRRDKAKVLQPGLRIHYWLKTPVLQQSQSVGATPLNFNAKPWPSPCIEVGAGSDGTVQVLHMPPLRQPGSSEAVALQLDTHSVDVEGVLLQATAVTANVQLSLLKDKLTASLVRRGLMSLCSLHIRPDTESDNTLSVTTIAKQQQQGVNEGAVATSLVTSSPSSTALAAGTSLAVAAAPSQHLLTIPCVMDIRMERSVLLQLSFEPWSGKLLLRPGSVFGGNDNIEQLMVMHQAQEQLYHQSQQQSQLHSNSNQPGVAVAEALLMEQAERIAALCSELWLQLRTCTLLADARTLSLHHTQEFRWLSDATQAAAAAQQPSSATATAGPAVTAGMQPGSGGSSKSRHHVYLSFPALPLPPYMASLSSSSSSSSGRPDPAAAAGASALGFVLSVQFPPIDRRRYALLVTAWTPHGLPGPVYKRVPVPCSAYAAAEQAVADNSSVDCTDGLQPLAAVGGLLGKRKRQGERGGVDDVTDMQLEGLGQLGDVVKQEPGSAVPDQEVAGSATATTSGQPQQPGAAQLNDALEIGSSKSFTISPSSSLTTLPSAPDATAGPVTRRGSSFAEQLAAAGSSGRLQEVQRHQQRKELVAVAAWCQQRMTFERLLFEMQALQVRYEECLTAASPATAGAQQYGGDLMMEAEGVGHVAAETASTSSSSCSYTMPYLVVRQLPGVPQLYSRHRRKAALQPSHIGVRKVVLVTGPQPNTFCMHVHGTFYHGTPARHAKLVTSEWLQYSYRFEQGDDVRRALHDLQRLVQVQAFLYKLECLAVGNQALAVAQTQPKAIAAGVLDDGQPDVGGKAGGVAHGILVANQEQRGVAGVHESADPEGADQGVLVEDGGDYSASPPLKKVKLTGHHALAADAAVHHTLPNGDMQYAKAAHAVLANGNIPAAAISDHKLHMPGELDHLDQQQQHNGLAQPLPIPTSLGPQLTGADMVMADGLAQEQQQQQQQGQQHEVQSTRHDNSVTAGVDGVDATSHVDATARVLQPPAPVDPSAAAAAVVPSRPGCSSLLWHWPGTGLIRLASYNHTQVVLSCGPPVQLLPGDKQHHAVAAPSAGPQHHISFTFTWHGSSTSQQPGSSSSTSSTNGSSRVPTTAADVVLVHCRVGCSHVVPEGLLLELGDMVDCGEEGLLLDALAVIAWPLAQLATALQPPQLAVAQLQPHDVSVTMSGSCYQARVLFGPSPCCIMIDLRIMCHGRVQLAISQLSSTTSAVASSSTVKSEAAPASDAATAATAGQKAAPGQTAAVVANLVPMCLQHLSQAAPGVKLWAESSSNHAAAGAAASAAAAAGAGAIVAAAAAAATTTVCIDISAWKVQLLLAQTVNMMQEAEVMHACACL